MSLDGILVYDTHTTATAGTDSSAANRLHGRAQAHARPALGQKISQQRRGEESDVVGERSGGVYELPAFSLSLIHI